MSRRPPGDPRNGHRYRTAVANLLANSDRCGLCGHAGARTADHVISIKVWLALHGTYEGVNHPSNLQPAHGTKGRIVNRCPTCDLLCNQLKGADTLTEPEPHSRDW